MKYSPGLLAEGILLDDPGPDEHETVTTIASDRQPQVVTAGHDVADDDEWQSHSLEPNALRNLPVGLE